MNRKAMALIEILVSMIVLVVAALAVTSTMTLVSGSKMRSAGGSSLDLQAASYARETFETLKNSVSTNETVGSLGAELLNGTHTSGVPGGFTRTYTVSDAVNGTDLKKVTVTLTWND